MEQRFDFHVGHVEFCRVGLNRRGLRFTDDDHAFFFSSRRRHTSYIGDWSSDVCSSDLAALASGRYLPSSNSDDLANFDVAVISVPTPLREGAPDLAHIEAAARTLAPHLRAGRSEERRVGNEWSAHTATGPYATTADHGR